MPEYGELLQHPFGLQSKYKRPLYPLARTPEKVGIPFTSGLMTKAENGSAGALVSTAELTREFLEAARYGDLEDVKAMVAQGVRLDSLDEQGRTALHMASANGHLDVVQYLISQGADVNAKNAEDNTPLHYAALNCHIPVLQELIVKGSDAAALNKHDRSPLDEALGRNNLAVVEAINAAAVTQSLSSNAISTIDMGGDDE
ncbi:hypothetical protein R1sor_026814 [Riccia sorocarpa]|uniref:Uncharacterized protein n=1 Tax=Riccia sorocarpa TaxID=122646 RepID=A0ABD3GE02_9MARC